MATPNASPSQRIPKAQALVDIRAAREALDEITNASTVARVAQVNVELTALAADPVVATAMKRDGFYARGMELAEADACPFCDTSWDIARLREHVQAKIDHLGEISRKRKAVEAKIIPLTDILQKVKSTTATLIAYAPLAIPPLSLQSAKDYSAVCMSRAERLATIIPLSETSTVLSDVPTVPPAVLDEIAALEKVVMALPEPTKQDAAREWLAVAQERLQVWRDAKRKHQVADEKARTARQVSDIYAATSDEVLSGLYAQVEKDLAGLYGFVNREDESKFEAKIAPSLGKLGFDVNFYGRGFFPPGAYHSEGHQDSMGLCLYLALMRFLQGNSFTFAVLDDVLMSVDAGHRREACALLKREFPGTQFILTTHDPIWLRHMKTEGLIDARSAVHFRSWDVDRGPTQWDDRDVWTEIDEHLKRNDVRAAAALLRHYLEHISTELCHRLRARVEFRGDARYQLGELLPAALSRMRKLFRSAKDVASSWGQKELINEITVRETEFSTLVTVSQVEQWQVNVAVHFNAWENLAKNDFAPVAKAFRDLLRAFTCPHCNQYLRVSPDRDTADSVRCECGRTALNLTKK